MKYNKISARLSSAKLSTPPDSVCVSSVWWDRACGWARAGRGLVSWLSSSPGSHRLPGRLTRETKWRASRARPAGRSAGGSGAGSPADIPPQSGSCSCCRHSRCTWRRSRSCWRGCRTSAQCCPGTGRGAGPHCSTAASARTSPAPRPRTPGPPQPAPPRGPARSSRWSSRSPSCSRASEWGGCCRRPCWVWRGPCRPGSWSCIRPRSSHYTGSRLSSPPPRTWRPPHPTASFVSSHPASDLSVLSGLSDLFVLSVLSALSGGGWRRAWFAVSSVGRELVLAQWRPP